MSGEPRDVTLGRVARLSALELAWQEMAGDGPPVAIGVAARCDGTAPDDAAVHDLIAERLPRMAPLQQRPQDAGAGWRRPAWTPVDGTSGQVHRVRATDAGAHDAFDRLVGGVMETHWPAGTGLWDVWVLEDLRGPSGEPRWGLVWRVDHSVSDGIGALGLLGHVFDTDPAGEGPTLADRVASSPPRPGSHRSVRAGEPRPSDPWHRLTRAASELPHLLHAGLTAAATTLPHPPSSITGPVGHRRRWVSAVLPLGEAKTAARALDATVNDVLLAVVAGGFRRLLVARGEAVDGRTVRAMMPVSARRPTEVTAGNHVSAVIEPLPVGEADPVARVRRVAETVGALKQVHAPLLAGGLLAVFDRAPAVAQDKVMAVGGSLGPSLYMDTVVTNVPGPQFPLWLAGSPVAGMHPIIPVVGRVRMTVGALSYDGRVCLGVTGDGEHAADVDLVAVGAREELDALLEAVSGRGGR